MTSIPNQKAIEAATDIFKQIRYALEVEHAYARREIEAAVKLHTFPNAERHSPAATIEFLDGVEGDQRDGLYVDGGIADLSLMPGTTWVTAVVNRTHANYYGKP